MEHLYHASLPHKAQGSLEKGEKRLKVLEVVDVFNESVC